MTAFFVLSFFFFAGRDAKVVVCTYLVNVAEDSLLDGLVLDDLTQDTTVTSTNDEDLLGVGVGVHGQVGDHLLVAIGVAELAMAIPST